MNVLVKELDYQEFDNDKQFEDYNLQQIDEGNIYAFYQLLEYYYDVKNDKIKGEQFENIAINKIFNIAIETQNIELLSMVAEYYCDEKKYLKMKECCTILLENNINCRSANVYLAEYYKDCDDYDNMMYHYNMINDKTKFLLNKMASYYKMKEDYDNMVKCYLLSIDKNDKNAMIYLGDYYAEIKDFYKARLYYEMTLNNISKRYSNFEIKKKLCKLDTVKECLICCIENIHTKFNCGHEICIDCINQLNRCYYRCN